MEQPYNKSIKHLESELETNISTGINSSQIPSKIEKYGYNELLEIKRNIWKIYLAPVFNFLILILLVSGIIVLILGSPESTIITFSVVIINSITMIFQQYRAQKTLDSLKKFMEFKATVLRDGKKIQITSREVLPGDIMFIEQGQKITADGRILSQTDLTINEASLTGESEAVEKTTDIHEEGYVPLSEQKNMVFTNTHVTTGRAKILVVHTGISSEIGVISSTINEMGVVEEIPLTRKLNNLAKILTSIVLTKLVILLIYRFTLLHNEDLLVEEQVSNVIIDSILRAMNVIPINLPLLTSLILITGVLDMARKGVIIRNLSAIESLGRVSVICTDKTGTITQNEMKVERFWFNNGFHKVTGWGYDPFGEILTLEGRDFNQISQFTALFLHSLVINNNASLDTDQVETTVKFKDERMKSVRRAFGSPTEAALLVLCEKAGLFCEDIKQDYNILKEYYFNSRDKSMSMIVQHKIKQELILFSKGAPEKIISISNNIVIEDEVQPFTNELKSTIHEKIFHDASRGYRILAFAYKNLANEENNDYKSMKRDEAESDLVFLGFASILDPPRPGVRKAVQSCHRAGIKVVMITGDHPHTAKTIAKQMGIIKKNELVIEGREIKNCSHDELEKATVFARVTQSDKVKIVEHHQQHDRIVAMTGDGVNDAPALKLANAGIAMGITGTDVAKEISDMIISDDNFESIERGVKIGRGLYAKIRTLIYFFICLNIMEAAIFFGYEFVPHFTLFSSNWQHLYIFGVVHALPSISLILDKHPKNVMEQEPKNNEELLSKKMWVFLLLQAVLMGISLILAIELTLNGTISVNEANVEQYVSYLPEGSTEEYILHMKARTMFMSTLYIMETVFIWNFRRPNMSIVKSFFKEFSPAIFLICGFTLALHVLLINYSFAVNYVINNELGLDFQLNFLYLNANDWLICILLACPGIIGIEIFKFIARRFKIKF